MKRRSALAGVVLTLTIAVAACGGGGGTDAAVSIKTLQAAVSNTEAAESSHFVMDVDVSGSAERVSIHGEGVMSADGKTGQITLSMGELGSIEERILDGTLYMNLSGLAAGSRLGDKEWVRADLKDLERRGGIAGLSDQAQTSGPKQGLEYLRGLSGDVTEVGDDTVAGRHATHYRASIDYAKVAADLPDSSAEVRDKLAKLGTVPADVWINDQDRVVKMHFVIDGGSFGAADSTTEMTMEITDFGVPVDVQAPPADQTVDLLSLGSIPT
jgi:hypothetical protein